MWQLESTQHFCDPCSLGVLQWLCAGSALCKHLQAPGVPAQGKGPGATMGNVCCVLGCIQSQGLDHLSRFFLYILVATSVVSEAFNVNLLESQVVVHILLHIEILS